jgi:hypothetical protein
MTQHLRCSAFALLLLVGLSSAVELENWRLQYYLLAAEVDALASSPSGMFWDDLRVTDTTLFGGALCPRSPGQAVGYWHVEPVVGGLASTDRYVDGQHVAAVADLTSDVRYGNLLARNTLNVDSRYKNDPDYVWKTDRVAAGRIEEAYLQIDHRYGFVRFGRLKRNWGPFADRSLLLSSNPHTYDALEWSVAGRFFEFRHLFAAFDRAHSTIDTDSSATGRYLAAHSLNLMFGGWATLGVTESVVFGCREGLPDFQYVNPFSIYTVTNTNAESNANLMLAFQWKVYPFTKRLSLAGQVLIDDIQVLLVTRSPRTGGLMPQCTGTTRCPGGCRAASSSSTRTAHAGSTWWLSPGWWTASGIPTLGAAWGSPRTTATAGA